MESEILNVYLMCIGRSGRMGSSSSKSRSTSRKRPMTSDGSSDAYDDNDGEDLKDDNIEISSTMSENSDDTIFVALANDLIFPNESNVPEKFESTAAFMKDYVGYTIPPRLSGQAKRAQAEKRREYYVNERAAKSRGRKTDRITEKLKGRGKKSTQPTPCRINPSAISRMSLI